MSGETLAVLLAAAIGLGVALAIERAKNRQAQAAADYQQAFGGPLGYSAFSSVPIGTLPSSPSTWAILR